MAKSSKKLWSSENKLTAIKSDKIIRTLKKKGFENIKGRTNHIRFVFFYNGHPINIKTHLSHNGQEIGDELQICMAEQLHLSKSEFLEMISCKIGYEDLLKKYDGEGLMIQT